LKKKRKLLSRAYQNNSAAFTFSQAQANLARLTSRPKHRRY